MSAKCFKHPRRQAAFKWRVCADGPWRGVCKECDVELNEIALRWAFPSKWEVMLKKYKERIGA